MKTMIRRRATRRVRGRGSAALFLSLLIGCAPFLAGAQTVPPPQAPEVVELTPREMAQWTLKQFIGVLSLPQSGRAAAFSDFINRLNPEADPASVTSWATQVAGSTRIPAQRLLVHGVTEEVPEERFVFELGWLQHENLIVIVSDDEPSLVLDASFDSLIQYVAGSP